MRKAMVMFYTLAIFGMAIAFMFTKDIVSAFSFFGTAMIPLVAVAGLKWGVLRGDSEQKIGVPLVAILLLAFAYWLSTGVSIQIFGYNLNGLVLGIAGSFVGLVGIPLSWAASSTSASSPAVSDSKIVSDYATFMANTKTQLDWFYDEDVLPHRKEAIIAAIEREIVREPLEKRVEWLKTGAVFLWNFQPGVGAAPLPSTGMDLSQLPRGGVAPADLSKLNDELKRILDSPNLRRDEARARHFSAKAKSEAKQIEERIAAAVRMRSNG